MPITVPFKQVDVFTSTFFKGNPVAVINCMNVSDEIPVSVLQSIANWTNLSETTFLFKPSDPKNDYKVRIFTPNNELPFAGHPTIGSCRAFLEFTEKKNAVQIRQECGLGIVELTISGKNISFKAIQTEIEGISEDFIEALQSCLSNSYVETPKLLHVGPNWVVGLVKDARTCYEMNPDYQEMTKLSKKYGVTGLIVAGKNPDSDGYEMRAFAPNEGVDEDPVCGSGSVALAKYLQEVNNYHSSTSFQITQGGRVGRKGKISANIKHEGAQINYHIGGEALTIIDGTINL